MWVHGGLDPAAGNREGLVCTPPKSALGAHLKTGQRISRLGKDSSGKHEVGFKVDVVCD
jgi:hypothetical protein